MIVSITVFSVFLCEGCEGICGHISIIPPEQIHVPASIIKHLLYLSNISPTLHVCTSLFHIAFCLRDTKFFNIIVSRQLEMNYTIMFYSKLKLGFNLFTNSL